MNIISDVLITKPGEGTTETLYERRITFAGGSENVFKWSSEDKGYRLPDWVPEQSKSVVLVIGADVLSVAESPLIRRFGQTLRLLLKEPRKCRRCNGRGEIESQKYATTRKGKRWLPCPACRSRIKKP